ncbi:MAG: hypothetical protein CMJ76_10420 [Planctomycetaceae bacterium]|nr:hypothetical protein [Planctomycetaceae bacterium]|tara:strand:- start:3048 stop:3335 length:288 start_codon:yes stop_codon:yes gene_type:complete
MDVVASEAMMRVSSPARINGNLKQKMEERGKKSGCGEFFWSSWYNDGPAEMSYSRPEPCEENTIHVSRHSSKAAHRIINSRPAVRVASIDLDDEI